MNEFVKTIVFVVVGSLLVACAFGVHLMSQPKEIDQFALVGEEFFPEFKSPSAAKFLEIVAFDFDKRKPLDFRVEYKDKMWRIPSHHGYPAEAADRLSKTAASVMGIRREAIGGRRKTEHKRFGVVDPTSEEATKIGKNEKDAVGIRVTLGKEDGKVLADYIIGKEVEARDVDNEMLREIRGEKEKKPLHYVRRPDEDETYIASIAIDASTKFSQWIEPDLLLLEADELRELVLNDYSFETKVEKLEVLPGVFQQVARSEKVDGESYTLTKDSDFGSWKLEGLDDKTEELETSKITDITRALDNFKILGVRPRVKIDGKPILTQDLKLEFPASIRTQGQAQRAIEQVALDLESKGFNLSQDPSDRSLRIASDQGELTAATSEGVVYRLYFGKTFAGTDAEIEIGGAVEESEESKDSKDSAAKKDAAAEKEEGSQAKSGDEAAAKDNNGKDDDADKKKSRYLLVRVEFDPKFLGDKPTAPVEPKEPEKPAVKKEEAGEKKPTKPQPPAPPEDKPTSPDPGKTEPEANKEADSNNSECGVDEEDAAAEADDSNEKESATAEEPKAGVENKKEDAPKENDDTTKPAEVKKEDETKKEGEAKPDEKKDPEAEYQDALLEYQSAKLQYDRDKTTYEKDLKKYEENLAKGKDKVAKLNARFADWYYVISAESLENLRLSRSDLVRKKEKPAEEKTEDGETKDDAAAANQAAADKFLAENKSKEGVTTTESGLQYVVLTAGEGESPQATSRVKVKYKGTLLDGTVFDESGDETVEFGVDQVIKGWTEALQLMKPGAKWRLFIPPALAYGPRGSGAKIGPNSLLIFEVELVSFE